jgi:CRP/FNR family cyclic AMP-dependent transcriptional regulator
VVPVGPAVDDAAMRTSRASQAHARLALGSVPLLAGLGRRALQQVRRFSTQVDLPAGAVLTRQDHLGLEAFLILDGTAEVRVDDRTVATVGVGDLVGEMAVLEHERRSATVVATSPVQLLVFEPRELASLLAAVPTLASRVNAVRAARREQLAGL